MPIRKKDGSLYKLRGPNKIMSQQEYWGDEVIVVHNWNQREPEIVEGVKTTIPEPPKEEIPKPAPVVQTVEIKPEPSEHRSGTKEEFYCLPADYKEYKDNLYEESIARIEYRDPFKFQAVVVSDNRVNLIAWTTVPHITVMSVLFHRGNRSWWRVKEIKPNPTGDGLFLHCVVSDIEPEF